MFLNSTYGQEKFVDFKGVVLNAKDSMALPFVHIGIKDIGIGGISNEDGSFLINIRSKYLEDSIIFSSIGFAPITLSIKESVAKDSLTVYMEKSSTFLPEILVTSRADSALMILKKAFRRIKQNYPIKPYRLEAFYREANIENSKYARLVEAAISIDDKGYRKPLSKMNFKLNQLRKSDDLRKLDWYGAVQEWTQENNGLVSFMMNDLMRRNTEYSFATYIETAILSRISREEMSRKNIELEKYFHNRNLDLVEYTTFENEPVWVIEITTDNNTRGFIGGLVSEGKVYVQQKNFAILGYDFYLKAKPKQRSTKELLSKPVRDKSFETMRKFAVDGENLLSRSVRYTRHKGRYYLSYMDTKMSGTSSRFLGSNWGSNSEEFKNRKKAKFYEHKQLMVSKININKKQYSKIKRKDRMNKDIALHNTEFIYQPKFWKNYNIVKRKPLGREAAQELSLNKELEIQFKANEKPHIQASRLSAQERNYISYTDKFNKIEYLEELNASTLLLTGVSNDRTYGFTPENPILLGTRNVYGNSISYPLKYLNALTGTKNKIKYQFKGYSNPFKTPNSRATLNNNPDLAFGLLIRCEIWEEGNPNKKTIYLNLNDEGEEVLAPKGFKYKKG